MSVIFSNCGECAHFKKVIKTNDSYKYICDAFPQGVPLDYMFRKEQNKNNVCNNGIKYKPE